MRTVIKVDFSQVDRLLDGLKRFQDYGVNARVKLGADKLVSHLKTNVAHGKAADGSQYPDIKDETLDMAINYSGPFKDTRIRREVSADKTPFNVTGKSIESIYAKQSGNQTEIVVDDPRSELVFTSNAKGARGKPVRDPLGLNLRNATDTEFDIIADLIDEEIGRIVNGL